ncbi:hypothetical protein C8R48DRAFT_678309 [Suillus tomentosus]|nr:hypothetical protein C8R48DRAFT_678309 [Suillus tomentosus]
MAKPQLYNTPEEKLEAARTYRCAYNACQRNKSLAAETKITKEKQDSAPSMPVGRPCIHDTPDKKHEARHRYRQVYYERRFHLVTVMSYVLKKTGKISIEMLAVTGSSSTANFVEGLCKYFISHPDDPDSLDVMWATIGVLENLHQHAQSVVDNVIEKCGMGSVVHRIPYFESVGFSQLWMILHIPRFASIHHGKQTKQTPQVLTAINVLQLIIRQAPNLCISLLSVFGGGLERWRGYFHGHNQHCTSPPHNNTPTPTEIPAPAHTPTAVELPNSTQPSVVMPESESLTVGLILAAPAASGGTLPVTKKASKRKPTESNAENLEMAAVKRQKGGAVVVSTENSQHHVEGGQGKRQHFQSSHVATANAIGT